jgi:hypothetical protein
VEWFWTILNRISILFTEMEYDVRRISSTRIKAVDCHPREPRLSLVYFESCFPWRHCTREWLIDSVNLLLVPAVRIWSCGQFSRATAHSLAWCFQGFSQDWWWDYWVKKVLKLLWGVM